MSTCNHWSQKHAMYMTQSDWALATIVLAVQPSLFYLIGDPEDPATVWNKLSGQFQKKTWANKLSLRRRLLTMKLSDSGLMRKLIIDELTVVASGACFRWGYSGVYPQRATCHFYKKPGHYKRKFAQLQANSESEKPSHYPGKRDQQAMVISHALILEEQKSHPRNDPLSSMVWSGVKFLKCIHSCAQSYNKKFLPFHSNNLILTSFCSSDSNLTIII